VGKGVKVAVGGGVGEAVGVEVKVAVGTAVGVAVGSGIIRSIILLQLIRKTARHNGRTIRYVNLTTFMLFSLRIFSYRMISVLR
jgi:hypothetical protein